jgi:hypothetical protein
MLAVQEQTPAPLARNEGHKHDSATPAYDPRLEPSSPAPCVVCADPQTDPCARCGQPVCCLHSSLLVIDRQGDTRTRELCHDCATLLEEGLR